MLLTATGRAFPAHATVGRGRSVHPGALELREGGCHGPIEDRRYSRAQVVAERVCTH